MSPHRRPYAHRLIALVSCCLVVAAGCSGGDDDDAAAPEPTVTSTTVAPTTTRATSTTTVAPTTTSTSTTSSTTTTLPAIARQPLTGVPLADDELPIDRPALAVKIDNATGARRNHRGLAVADIVYEEIVEGSITRFAAVFHSQGSEVGPIRSGRSQDVDLLASYIQPLFAWSGGNPGVERLIADSTLTDLNWQRGGRGYYRGPGAIPHNLYNDTETLWSQTPEGHPGSPPPQQFEYVRPGESFQGDPVGGLEVAMRGIDVEWSWDAEEGRFLRSQQGNPHVDVLHGRIGADNVLVLGTWYRPSAIDARSPEAQTISEGAPLWVFSNGQVRTGRWIRTDPLEPMRLVGDDGAPILLTPGITWVELAEGEFTGDPANPAVDVTVLPPG